MNLLPSLSQKAKKAILESRKSFQKDVSLGKRYRGIVHPLKPKSSRDMTPFYDGYADAETQEEINAIAMGQILPYGMAGLVHSSQSSKSVHARPRRSTLSPISKRGLINW